MDDANVQELCGKLVANDPEFLTAEVLGEEWSDENMDRVAEAMKRNTTLEEIRMHLDGGVLSLRAELSLFSAVMAHPKVKKLSFWSVEIEDLGVVVRMIRKSERRLAHLSFDFCSLHSGCLDSIGCLVGDDLLESLRINDCGTVLSGTDNDAQQEEYAQREEYARLAEALGRNRALKELTIEVGYGDEREEISMFEWTPDLCRLLRGNQVLSKLSLRWHQTEGLVQNGSEIMSRIAQAATGHASLQNLALDIETNLNEDGAAAIGSMLCNSPTLRELSLRDVSIEPAVFRQLGQGLQGMERALEKLDLSHSRHSDRVRNEFGSIHLGELLGSNPNLRSLDLSRRGIDSTGACALAEGLKQNHTLEELNLASNDIGNEGTTVIAEALASNDTIKLLDISFRAGVDGPTLETQTAVLKAVETNTTLKDFQLDDMSDENAAKMEYLLTLNCCGRRILSSQSAVPLNYWPRILANSSHNDDVLFFFLKEKHDALVPRADARPIATRKRKRDEK